MGGPRGPDVGGPHGPDVDVVVDHHECVVDDVVHFVRGAHDFVVGEAHHAFDMDAVGDLHEYS